MDAREESVFDTTIIASQNQLVDLQILCGPLETQGHMKTSHRPMNALNALKHFPGFQEAIL